MNCAAHSEAFLGTFAASGANLGEQSDWIGTQSLRDRQELQDVDAPLSCLIGRDERLRLVEHLGKLGLSDASLPPRGCQAFSHDLMLVRSDPHGLPMSVGVVPTKG